jgi:hypothetical protein
MSVAVEREQRCFTAEEAGTASVTEVREVLI